MRDLKFLNVGGFSLLTQDNDTEKNEKCGGVTSITEPYESAQVILTVLSSRNHGRELLFVDAP